MAGDTYSDEWVLRLQSPWLSPGVTYQRRHISAAVKFAAWFMDREVRGVNAWRVLQRFAPAVHERCSDVWREYVYFPHMDTFWRDLPPYQSSLEAR